MLENYFASFLWTFGDFTIFLDKNDKSLVKSTAEIQNILVPHGLAMEGIVRAKIAVLPISLHLPYS